MAENNTNKGIRVIAIDLTPVLPGGENGGAKIFVLELIKLLANTHRSTKFVLFIRDTAYNEISYLKRQNVVLVTVLKTIGKPEFYKDEAKPVLYNTMMKLVFDTKRMYRRLRKSIKKRFPARDKAVSLLKGINADLLFCPFTDPVYYEEGIPTVCTIYDLQHKTYPEFFDQREVKHRDKVIKDACSHAVLLASISNYTKESVLIHSNLTPNRIRTIYLRMARRFSGSEEELDVLNRLKLEPSKYLIYPANFWKHKNHEMLFTAFGIACIKGLPIDVKLLCTGAPIERQRWLIRAVREMGLEDRIVFSGYLSDSELSKVILSSLGIVFPSLYEGFGLPVIEGMASGIPVACSNICSLPEVAGEAAIQFDPRKPDDIADAIIKMSIEQELRNKLIDAGLERAELFADSELMAKEYWKIFVDAIEYNNDENRDALAGVWQEKFGQKISKDNHDAISKKVKPSDKVRISVVTPSYNQGKFIERTILSVQFQDIDGVEHLIYDGCSGDETKEILKKYEKDIRWVSEKDHGQAHAVNKGLVEANGDIIGWLNSDDIYYPGALAEVLAYFNANPGVEVVYGRADHIDMNDIAFEEYPTECWNDKRLIETCYICQPAVFFRREVIDRYGLLDQDLHYCMDYEYWLRLGQKGAMIGFIDQKLAGSRLYKENKTLGSTVSVHREINDMIKKKCGKVPKRWLKNYAHVSTHDNVFDGKVLMPRLQFDIRYFFARLRWNGVLRKN
ncbi:MAG TPA: glycosyltransferase [Desulfitobacteriaceae bacterium]|nr:glycosyltransferase [Desulfitobacteriaceae bacterium]